MSCYHPQIAEQALRKAKEYGDTRPVKEILRELFAGLESAERQRIADDWGLWALPYQRMPAGDWKTWAMVGGRGIGKSWTASKTIHEVAKDVESLGDGIIAIVGRTHTDVRETNIKAKATGLLAAAPHGFCPTWRPGPGELVWPNGARGRVFAAESPESIRGQNIAFAVGDEVAVWKNGDYVWHELLELACRRGRAQMMMTTTPRPLKWLKKVVGAEDTVVTGASTFDNPFLTEKYIKTITARFEGTSVADQELRGIFLDTTDGALLKKFEYISDSRIGIRSVPELVRIVVSVDPAVTTSNRSDPTGMVVFGVDKDGHGYLLEDATDKYDISNNEWAETAVSLFRKYGADKVVAEVNRGGDMVEAGLRACARNIPYEGVRATRGKITRAAPVGSLYERGLIHHVGEFPELEQELTTWIPGNPSPNRMDAVVWAATYLMLDDEVFQPWDTPLAYLGQTL